MFIVDGPALPRLLCVAPPHTHPSHQVAKYNDRLDDYDLLNA